MSNTVQTSNFKIANYSIQEKGLNFEIIGGKLSKMKIKCGKMVLIVSKFSKSLILKLILKILNFLESLEIEMLNLLIKYF